jgi:hypothetical protein
MLSHYHIAIVRNKIGSFSFESRNEVTYIYIYIYIYISILIILREIMQWTTKRIRISAAQLFYMLTF